MSFFDDASLVMIPSGYKDQKVYSVKPIDGTGDLTFSRASSATRVNSSGLVEKVRENLILQSQDFSTTWSANSCTVTTNTTANPLNGAVDADTITFTGATTEKYVIQAFSFNGVYTVSAYLKAGTNQFVQFLLGSDAAVYVNFDLVNGTRSGAFGSVADMVSLGNGWYRCSMSFTSTTGTHVFIQAVDSLAAYRFSPTTSTGTLIAFGYQLETGDIATDYIATTTAAVSVGPVSGLPRLDYSGGASCPSLLLEPQRTNLALYSEQIDNAYYGKINSSITANATISPDGYTNADKLVDDTTNGYHAFETSGISTSIGAVYTVSLFAKKGEKSILQILFDGGDVSGNPRANFDLQNGVLGSVDAAITATITDYGNGWYRCTATATSAVTSLIPIFCIVNSATSSRVENYVGNGTDGLFVWGAQVEAGSYATSYLNTLSTAVTRVADDCYKSGIGSMFSGSFTLFANVVKTSDTGPVRFIMAKGAGGTYNNFIDIENYQASKLLAVVTDNSATTQVFIIDNTNYTAGQTMKIAFQCKAGEYQLWVNGSIKGSSSYNSLPTVTDFRLAYFDYYSNNLVNQAMILPELTPAQLAELTA